MAARKDPYAFALEFLRTDPEFRSLQFSEYWGGLTMRGLPLVAHDLEDAIELRHFRTHGAGPSDRFVRRVVHALETICRNRIEWGIAA